MTASMGVHTNIECLTTLDALSSKLAERGWVRSAPEVADCLVLDPGLACTDSAHPVHDLSPALIDSLSQAATAFAMRARPEYGSIVLVTSRDSLGTPHAVARSAVSAAVIALGRSLALTYAARRVTVNTVVGPARPEAAGGFEATQLLPEPVTGGDIAEAVLFFADPRSQYMTGQTLYVCGGASMLSSLSV